MDTCPACDWPDDIDYVLGLQEASCIGMADGYARTSHTPGVATATCGPGTTQLATAFVTINAIGLNGKPFTVPISAAYRRPPHTDDVSVVVKANGIALYGDEQEEVFVSSIDGDRAVIMDKNMTEITVPLADLSPVGLG